MGYSLFLASYCFGAIQKIMWKLNKSIAKDLLPTQPVDFVIEPWWGVCLVNFTLEEFKVSCLVLVLVFELAVWHAPSVLL